MYAVYLDVEIRLILITRRSSRKTIGARTCHRDIGRESKSGLELLEGSQRVVVSECGNSLKIVRGGTEFIRDVVIVSHYQRINVI